MKINVIPGNRLTPELVSRWAQFQRDDPALSSPYFRPEFTQAVASVRDDVEVGVMISGGEPVGFFPYQRNRRGVARPVGGRLSDYQGVIARRDLCWNAEELLRGCRLKAWHFDHLVAGQEPFSNYHRVEANSLYIDLSDGFDAYLAARPKSGKQEIRKTLRKMRQAEREIGPVRFEAHTADESVFRTLVDWKVAQYRKTKVPNALGHPWSVALLERIRREQSEAFAGMMSVVYIGDRLAAVHLGMRSYDVLHLWFPAYNPSLSRYSPGTILSVKLIQAAHALGIRTFDFSVGSKQSDPYKLHFTTGSFPLAEGSVDLRPVVRGIRSGWRATHRWVRSSPLRKPARLPAHVIYRVSEWFAFR